METDDRRKVKKHIHHCHPDQIHKYVTPKPVTTFTAYNCQDCQTVDKVQHGNNTATTVTAKMFKCDKCNKKYKQIYHLKQHYDLKHSERAVFRYDEC